MKLRQLDRKHVWHPFTQTTEWAREDFPIIERGEGCWLIDVEGRRYLDGVASLWCNVHGHRVQEIDMAVASQLSKIAHSTFLGLSHPPGIELAKRLIDIAPHGLTRVFFSDSGSAAVEVALKMAFQFWSGRKRFFIKLAEAYHGDTLGSVSVGGIDVFHQLFRPLLFPTLRAPTLDALEHFLRRHAGEVAAVVIEPRVRAAGGILLNPPGFERAVRRLCTRHDALMIADEVATGFGRTGTMFACEGVAPDLLCLGKGLTGGYLPLSATLATERVFDAFTAPYEKMRTFFHGHTYAANPLACAAAIASLDLMKRRLRDLPPKIRLLSRGLARIKQIRGVHDVRQRGFIAGIELGPFPPARRTGRRVTLEARKRGVILRPLGDVVVLCPPLAISCDELTMLLDVAETSIRKEASWRAPSTPSRSPARSNRSSTS